MIDIQLTGLVKEFEVGRKILDGFSLQVDTGERVGLLGRNGAGKTTIFRIITGEVEADEGTVTIAPGKRVGLISQIPVYPEGYTVEDVLDTAFERLHNIERELAELGMKMGDHPTQSVMERYDKLTAAFEAGGGYHTKTQLNKVCNGLAIDQDMRGRLFSALSGGEKTRLALATLVTSRANVLLLDEPTNNLDPASRDEILKAIAKYEGAIVLVTHDEGAVEALNPERVLLMPDGDEDLWNDSYLDLVAEE